MKTRLLFLTVAITAMAVIQSASLNPQRAYSRNRAALALGQVKASINRPRPDVSFPKTILWLAVTTNLPAEVTVYKTVPSDLRRASRIFLQATNEWPDNLIQQIEASASQAKKFASRSKDQKQFVSGNPVTGAFYYKNDNAEIVPGAAMISLPDPKQLMERVESLVAQPLFEDFTPARKPDGSLQIRVAERIYTKGTTKTLVSWSAWVPKSYGGFLPKSAVGGGVWIRFGKDGQIFEFDATVRKTMAGRKIPVPKRAEIEGRLRAGNVSNADDLDGKQSITVKAIDVFYDERPATSNNKRSIQC